METINLQWERMTDQNDVYIFASSRPWNISTFQVARPMLSGRWALVADPADLEAMVLATAPRYAFFPHWSHIVPRAVLERVECVCFHMTDVPYGRGGSPLQNLISRGHTETVISALRMVPELDAGPVYIKRPFSLEGSAQEIFERASVQIMNMIDMIVREEPVPIAQEGAPTIFTRRKPEESLIPVGSSLKELYDHIRMLDADGYPHAFIDHGDWRVHFTDAHPNGNRLEARACFTKREDR